MFINRFSRYYILRYRNFRIPCISVTKFKRCNQEEPILTDFKSHKLKINLRISQENFIIGAFLKCSYSHLKNPFNNAFQNFE